MHLGSIGEIVPGRTSRARGQVCLMSHTRPRPGPIIVGDRESCSITTLLDPSSPRRPASPAGRLFLSSAQRRVVRRPAGVLGLPAGSLAAGSAADICLFDPKEAWRYDAKAGFSRSSNSPWHGRMLTGRVKATIVDGRLVYADGKIV